MYTQHSWPETCPDEMEPKRVHYYCIKPQKFNRFSFKPQIDSYLATNVQKLFFIKSRKLVIKLQEECDMTKKAMANIKTKHLT